MIYVDETVFTRKAIRRQEWSKKGLNMEVNNHLLNEKTQALLMGISYEKGVEQWKIFPKSVDTDKFIRYLEMVREANGNKKITLFMDNLGVHKTKRTKKRMEELGIIPIYNIYY